MVTVVVVVVADVVVVEVAVVLVTVEVVDVKVVDVMVVEETVVEETVVDVDVPVVVVAVVLVEDDVFTQLAHMTGHKFRKYDAQTFSADAVHSCCPSRAHVLGSALPLHLPSFW